jgi:small-conductance mechanosensitive channel/CRP-like cAMP-binding protein
MIAGLTLLLTTLVLRGATLKNRHVGRKLTVSAVLFGLYAAAAFAIHYATLDATLQQQIRTFQPLLLVFGVVNLLVAVVINPWRDDRLPDRFPNIVQDAIVVLLFAVAAALILRDRMLTATAAGAVVLGFALQDTLGNLIAGLAIQIEKPFRVGHWVSLGGHDGLVSEITWRATKIRTKAGNFVIVPNSVLAKDTITNYSEPTQHTRVDLEVGASYDTPPNEVKATILAAIGDEPLVARDRQPEVLVSDFGASAVMYLVRVWTTDFSADQLVRDRVRTAVYYAFRRRGIEIPYPIEVQMPRERGGAERDRDAHDALEAALRGAQIFAALTDAQRAELLRTSRPALYGAGEVIVREGDPGRSMFVVARGEAVVTLAGSPAPVAHFRAGDFFGEMSLLTGDPRTATVTAATDCHVIELDADRFRSLVMAEPIVADLICTAVEKRRAELDERRAATAGTAAVSPPPRSLITRMRQFLRLSAIVAAAAIVLGSGRAETAEKVRLKPDPTVHIGSGFSRTTGVSEIVASGFSRTTAAIQLTSADGRRTMTAVEARAPITLDGSLDEESWLRAEAAAGFLQAEPHEGQPATELTEVRVVFDRDALYVGVVCHDEPGAGLIVNDIRKDFSPGEQDSFEMILDTFADRRNGYVFVTNPAGAKSDAQIANEGREVNASWDAVWTVAAKRGTDGWSAEMRIPFKTLRFERGLGQIWGVNFSRRIRRKNEIDYWSPVPRVYNLYRASFGGTLAGLPDASQGRNLRIKPFVSANSTRGVGAGSFSNGSDVGVDVKYGVTPSLTVDATARPDFAQAEADEQQVNLTQFSVYYPEKREFFLENSGTFYFGDIPRESRLGFARFAPPEEEILLFFSRRIGLTDTGEAIPLAGGARLTGRAGTFGIGAMTIQTESIAGRAGDNYTVLRGRRDIFNNSDVGAIVLSRQSSGTSGDFNRVVGGDANFRFFRAFSVNSFIARSDTPGVADGQVAGKASATWNANFLHAQYSFLSIGDHFRDDIGFIKRTGIRKHFVDFGVRPRPERLRKYGIREVHPHTRYNIYTDQSDVKVSHTNHVAAAVFFENGAWFEAQWNPRFERIVMPFKLGNQAFAPGSYGWNEYALEIESNHSRKISGSALLTTGGFWNGTQKSAKVGVIVRPSYHLTFDTAFQRNDIDLPFPMHAFATNLVTSRIGYAFNTRMFLDTLLQYNTDLKQVSANVRLDLIHRPLSDLFVVYNEQQLTSRDITSGRGLIVKYTHMVAF